MSTEIQNDAPAVFSIDGVEYPVVTNITLGEARDIKRVYGVKLADLETLLDEADPDALASIVYVSMRRVDPTVAEADVDMIDLSDFAVAATVAPGVDAAPLAPSDASE